MPSFKGGLKAIANSLTIAPQQQPAQQHPLGYGNGQGRPPTSSQDGAPGRQGNGQAANGGARNASHNVRDENEEGEENPFEGESSQVNGQPRTPHRANTGEQKTNLVPGASENSEVDLHVAQLYNNAQRSLIDEQDGIDGSGATGSTNRQPHAGNQPGVIQAWNNGNVQQADFYHVVHFVKWLIEQHPDKFRKPLPTSDDPNLLQYVTSHVDYYFRELNKLAVAYEKDTKSLDKQLTEAKKKQKPIMDTHIQRSEYEKLQKQRDRVVLENKTLTEQNKQHVKHANEQTRAVNTLDSELKTLRFRNTQLEGTNKRLGGEAAGNSATISTLKSEVQRLVEQCKTLTTDVSTRDGQIGGLNGRIVDLESERDYARGVLAGEKEKLRLEHNEEKGQLQTRHDREREELMNKHDAAMTTLRQDHSGKYGALEQQLRSAQGEAERQRSNMSDKHREEVKKLKTEHSTAITEATSRLEKKITTMQTKHDESQDALGKKHKDELASYEEDAKMYQRALTTSADSVQSLTDAGLRDKLAQLKNAVEALSRAPFREKPAPDMTVLGEISGQAEIVSTMPSKHRKFLLESAIWSLLMRELFTLPVGLSSIGPGGADLVQLWVMLFATTGSTATSDGVNLPAPESLGEQWRSLTTEALRRNVLGQGPVADEARNFREAYLQSQAAVRKKLTQMLAEVGTVKKPGDIDAIVERASTMAVLFGTQKARLEMCLPSTGQSPSEVGYEVTACNESDVANVKNTVVQFGVSPGLRKWGNARGGSLETMNRLVPAIVYARPA